MLWFAETIETVVRLGVLAPAPVLVFRIKRRPLPQGREGSKVGRVELRRTQVRQVKSPRLVAAGLASNRIGLLIIHHPRKMAGLRINRSDFPTLAARVPVHNLRRHLRRRS